MMNSHAAMRSRGRDRRRIRPVLDRLEARQLLSRSGPVGVGLDPSGGGFGVAFISKAVPGVDRVAGSAVEGVVPIRFDPATSGPDDLIDRLESASRAQGGARIDRLAIVAHGHTGSLAIAAAGRGPTDWVRLREFLAPDSAIYLYACDLAEGPGGRAFVDEIAALTGSVVFASTDPVGVGIGADLDWEYRAGGSGDSPAAEDPLDRRLLGTIAGLRLDDAYEDNDTKAIVDSRPQGAANSSNLGFLQGTRLIGNLALQDAADYYKFALSGVGTSAHSVRVDFDRTTGDADLIVYRGDGSTIVGASLRSSSAPDGGTELVPLTGEVPGYYYAVVRPKSASSPVLANYSLTIDAPGANPGDRYENNDTKAIVDSASPGAADSPNLGAVIGSRSIDQLQLEDAADWYRFVTIGVGSTAASVSISFDRAEGDVDLYVYRADGVTLVGSSVRSSGSADGGAEVVSLAGELGGVFYAKVVAKSVASYSAPGLADYRLRIDGPTKGGGDPYEDNDSKAIVDGRPRGAVNSPNLGNPVGVTTIAGLRLEDAADWYRFELQAVGGTSDYVKLDFDRAQGDVDLYVYRFDGATLVGASTNPSGLAIGGSERVSLAGALFGIYYAKVVAKSSAAGKPPGLADYSLTVALPAPDAGDVYEENDTKAAVDARPAGAAESPNFGLVVGSASADGLQLEDAADWYRFEIGGVGTTADSVAITFDRSAGDVDLAVYRSDGTTPVGLSANSSASANGGLEQVSLAGAIPGVYYAVVTAKSTASGSQPGIDDYNITINAPTNSGDDLYELNNSPGGVAGYEPGALNSPNLGPIDGPETIAGLVLADPVDWFRFELSDIAGPEHDVRVSFDRDQGDVDLYIYKSDGVTLVGSSTKSSGSADGGLEQVGLGGRPAGAYYAKIVAKSTAGFRPPGLAAYELAIRAPGVVDPGVVGFQIAGLTVSESGGEASIQVERTEGSSGPVSIHYATAAGSAVAGIDYASVDGTLDWADGELGVKTFTIAILSDDVAESLEDFRIVLDRPTGSVRLGPIADAIVTIEDDDVAGFLVAPTTGLVTTEAGGSSTFTVRLTSRPIASVTITIASDRPNEGVADRASLTFDPVSWDTPQVVTIVGRDDPEIDGDAVYTIRVGPAQSDDSSYEGMDPTDVEVTNRDDDQAGFVVEPADGLVTTEAGGSASFRVRLTSRPTALVVIPIGSDRPDEGRTTVTSLTFTPENWSVAQTVVVEGQDDPDDDGDVVYTVRLGPAASDDPNYEGLDPSDVAATNLDDDTAGFLVTPTTGLVTTEAGGSASFTVRLRTRPTSTVTIPVASDRPTEGRTIVQSLTFTSENWFISQTVIVDGVDDPIADGDAIYTVVLGFASSQDPGYDDLDPIDVALTNLDDDQVGIAIEPIGGSITVLEGGASDSYTIRLTSRPIADVTIRPAPDGALVINPNVLIFTTEDWATPRLVTVKAPDDHRVQGPRTGRIAHRAESTDPAYAALAIPDQIVQIEDARRLQGDDYDGDGRADTVVFEPSTATFFIARSSLGNTTVQVGPASSFKGGAIPVPADYDGDGLTDPAVFDPRTSTYYLMTSGQGLRTVQIGQGTLYGGSPFPVPADFDGDGQVDPAVFEPSTATFYLARSRDGNRAVQFGRGTKYGGSPVPVPADYDGDGKADPGVFEPSNATFYLARSEAGNKPIQFGQGTLYGGDPMPVPADFDGDGLTDPSVFEPSTATFYLARSRDGNRAVQFGQGTRYGGSPLPVPADFDGDGKADPGVFEPSTATFYLARSRDGNRAVQFGQGTLYGGKPVAVPADFDGDGKADPAVFEPSTATFYLARSEAGNQAVQFGQGTLYGGDPIPLPLPLTLRVKRWLRRPPG